MLLLLFFFCHYDLRLGCYADLAGDLDKQNTIENNFFSLLNRDLSKGTDIANGAVRADLVLVFHLSIRVVIYMRLPFCVR